MPSIICVRRALIGLGVTEFILGLGIAICGGASISVESRYYKLFHGFWGGGAFMAVGLFAIFAGWRKSKCCEMSHMVLAILGCALLYPILSTIWMAEIAYDGYASYYSDPPLCKDGCIYEKQNSYYSKNTDYYKNEEALIDSGDSRKLFCESLLWKTTCNPNEDAVYVSFAAILIVGIAFVLFIVSSCYACCIVCKCCGVRFSDDSVKPQFYPSVNMGHGYGYPGVTPGTGMVYAPPQRRVTTVFPTVDSPITSEVPSPSRYVPGSEELDNSWNAPEPARPEPVLQTPVPPPPVETPEPTPLLPGTPTPTDEQTDRFM